MAVRKRWFTLRRAFLLSDAERCSTQRWRQHSAMPCGERLSSYIACAGHISRLKHCPDALNLFASQTLFDIGVNPAYTT